ncbi:Tc toxin subunit A-related protein [Okeania hirsuta]|nr:neuraminidase-like domain-containing protein [Okeania hirsuta]
MKIYVNGTLWHSEGDKNQPINLANKVVLGNFISNNGTLSNNWYEGLVAHLQIYSKELSPTEINKKYLFLSQVERFREATKLSIEEFNQFYPNYRVKDDADNSYETNKVYGTYISNGHNLTLKTVDAKLVMGHDDGTYLNHDFFYRFNRIIRLQKRTNIPYYQLDWLLNTIEDQDGLIDDDRLNVIAHYLDWNHKYQFSVDEFVGILTEINSYRRMGEQETSLLRQIFGNAAPKLVKVLKDGSTKFADLESSLKEYLIIGLRITFAEYNAIVKVITNNDENAKFDKAALARMYRLVKVFTLFGWGIAKGIELVEKLGLIEVFAHPGQKVSDVLSALDKLVWLSEWINAEDNNLTIDNILTILTPPDDAGTLQATVEVEEFLDLLEQDIEEHRVVEQSFTNYESWQIIVEKAPEEDHEGIGIMGIPADIWYQLLQENEPKIIDKYGLVLNVEKANIAEGVTKIIKDKIEAAAEKGYQLTLTESAEGQKQELIVEIANFQRRQQESLAKIITEKLSGLSSEIIPDLLRWMGIDYYETLKQLLGLQDKEVPEKLSQDTLKLLYNINRHGIVISQLELDTYTVSIAAEKPEWLVEWLVEEMSHKLSLEQVYYLYKFKTLLNAKVSSQHWFVYLAAVNEGELEEEEQNKLLAAFLDWSVEDIPNLTNKITYSLVKTVQQIEYLRRQIELCQDLHIQGEQLQWFHHYDIIPDFWQQVVPVVKLGLNRQNDEVRKKTAKDAINLELRDALVANFMNEVVGESESPALKEKIKSWEDIYQYLLLDVNVSYEVPTTRLLECTGAVQLYINRMIQGVEDANWEKGQLENLKKSWDISQQYRLWEANEKLGLYPSSYIEPTLRLHKTEIFETFEKNLGQGSLNEEMVQQAIMQYLEQIQQLSELRVEGFTSQKLRDSIEFCFTAKATWETNSYYYRLLTVDKTKLEAGSKYPFEWGAWMKAELVFSQQHIYGLAPCYGWNRLYMYWFELFETRSKDGQTTEYYLQPKYCRQNTDGSFGQPRNSVMNMDSSINGIDDPITMTHQGIKITYEGENIVEDLQVEVFEPYFDQKEQKILMYFSAGVSKDSKDSESLPFFSSVTSKEETVVQKINDDQFDEEYQPLDGYYAIHEIHPSQVKIQPQKATDSINWGSILPDNRRWSNLYLTGIEMKWTGAVINNNEVTLNWEFDCRDSRYNLTKNLYFGWVDHSRFGYTVCKNLSHEETQIKLIPSNNEFNEQVVTLAKHKTAEGNNPLGFSNKEGYVKFKLDQNQTETEFDITLKVNTKWQYSYLVNWHWPLESREDTKSREETRFTFHVHYNANESLQSVFVRNSEDNPSLADQRFLLFPYKNSFYTTNLYSTAIQRVVELAHPYYDIHQLFDLDHQHYKEEGIQDYLDALKATDTYSEFSDPQPDTHMDFWGPYGIYAWEIFHYIPLMVAYKYTQSQNFDLAKKWLKHVYDPTLKDDPWGNYPLEHLPNGVGRSALGINDPDARARETPYYYRRSTIRQYIQNLIEQGDYYYRQIATETLRQAKMYYVEAKNIFIEGGQSLANVQLGEDWKDPTLGDVKDEDFIAPYDEEIMKVYQTIEQRLYNLRHWLAIDGTPLNIPLIAPPIDPRVLQQAALAGVSPTQFQQQATRTLNYDFDDILGRARGYVQDLISWSTNLLQYWENYENIQYQNLADSFISFDSAIFMQEKTIEALEKNIEIQQKTKEQSISEVIFNEFEIVLRSLSRDLATKYKLAVTTKQFLSIPMNYIKAALKMIPNIFGTSNGGSKYEATAEANLETNKSTINLEEGLLDQLQEAAEIAQDLREFSFNIVQTKMAIEIIDQEIEVSNIELEIERQVLEDIKGDKKDSETLAAFNQKRFTNEMFFKWYVDNLKQLYRTLFDQTVSFCLLAERVYQEEIGEKTIFIRPQWDDVYHGLLSGQKLLLNLQQMEYTYLQKTLYDDQPVTRTFSLEEKDDNILASLKTHGKAVIHIQESWFEEDFPEEFGRRIQSVKVKFLGLEGSDPIAAELTQISNRYSAKERTLQRVCAYGKIKLLGVETDTATMTPKQKGRLLPFEGSGVESTWLLSVPAAVKAIQEKQITYKHKSTLEKLEDIEMTIRYTAKS